MLNVMNVAKLCRICLAEGARNIFDCTNSSTTQSSGGGVECAASLENLLEKMRYITMAQIKENDSLPKLICDCCIVQLNVAYNFKRKAVDNDHKLRQYIIEKGLDATIDENPSNAPALYYTSNISIMQNNSENVENHFNMRNLNSTNSFTNTDLSSNARVSEIEVPATNQITNKIPQPIPIKLEYIDNAFENESNSRIIPESNIPNPNLMVIVNDNNALSTQSMLSSNSIPSSDSSSFTTDNNLRDSEFLRNYVQNKIICDVGPEKHVKCPIKVGRRYKPKVTQLQEKFLKKHIKRNLGNESGPNSPSPDNFKVSGDLRKLIMDQKENFSSALKMRNQNKQLFYSLRRNIKTTAAKKLRPKKKGSVVSTNNREH